MKTHYNNKATRSNSRNKARRDWKNPSRSEAVPVGEWEADVVAKKDGRHHAALRRKVLTRGFKYIHAGWLISEVVDHLRHGYEVRLVDYDQTAAVRLFPCLDKEFKAMFVTAETMGDFRHCVNDIKFHVSSKGEELDIEEAVDEYKQKLTNKVSGHACVTPNTMVECPKCGFEFRVGKVLSNKKEG